MADLEQVLAAALAMLISTETDLKTRQDFRHAADDLARYIREFAWTLRDGGDLTPRHLLDALNMRRSSPN